MTTALNVELLEQVLENPDDGWDGHERAWLWLDDGRVIDFGAFGYDAWGATVDEIRVVDVERCDNCGQEHPDSQLYTGWPRKDGRAFAWCTDGSSMALVLDAPPVTASNTAPTADLAGIVQAVRELHAPQDRFCRECALADFWPCRTARLVYSEDEIRERQEKAL